MLLGQMIEVFTHHKNLEKKTKHLFFFTPDEALQPSRLSRRSHTDRSR